VAHGALLVEGHEDPLHHSVQAEHGLQCGAGGLVAHETAVCGDQMLYQCVVLLLDDDGPL